MANRGVYIPDFSALNQFVNPVAEFGKYASEYSNRVREDEAAIADRMYREKQAQIQIDQFNQNHKLDVDKFNFQKLDSDRNFLETQANNKAEREYRLGQLKSLKDEYYSKKHTNEADNALINEILLIKDKVPFKDTVNPAQTYSAKEAALVVNNMNDYNRHIQKARSEGNLALAKQLEEKKNNYGLNMNDKAKYADYLDNQLVLDPYYTTKVGKKIANSDASYKIKMDILKQLSENSVASSNSFTPTQLANISEKLGMNVSNLSDKEILDKLGKVGQESISKSKSKSETPVGKAGVVLNESVRQMFHDKPQRAIEVGTTENFNRIDALARKKYPYIYAKDPERARLKFNTEFLIPELNTQKHQWYDMTNSIPTAPTEVNDALNVLEGK